MEEKTKRERETDKKLYALESKLLTKKEHANQKVNFYIN